MRLNLTNGATFATKSNLAASPLYPLSSLTNGATSAAKSRFAASPVYPPLSSLHYGSLT